MPKILFVEDDAMVAHSISQALRLDRFSVTITPSVSGALEYLEKERWDAILLDLNLADGNGLEVCKAVGVYYPNLPVVVLSARSEEETVVRALASGVIDYMRKPTGTREIAARLRKAMGTDKSAEIGSLVLNFEQRKVTVNAREVKLRKAEFDILAALAKKPGAVVNRQDLLNRSAAGEETSERTIDSHLSHIRKKLREAGADDISIESVYALGYTLKKAA